jgi:hypothetical protein
MAAPAELEEIVEEFRPAVREIVRRLVRDLARQELEKMVMNGRPAAAEIMPMNDGPGPDAETVLGGHRTGPPATRALGEGSDTSETANGLLRRCRACDTWKPPDAFEPGRHEM